MSSSSKPSMCGWDEEAPAAAAAAYEWEWWPVGSSMYPNISSTVVRGRARGAAGSLWMTAKMV